MSYGDKEGARALRRIPSRIAKRQKKPRRDALQSQRLQSRYLHANKYFLRTAAAVPAAFSSGAERPN